MRYFNTYGPVNEAEHYVVGRSKVIADLVAQIERGKYFNIHAAEQMGKTTLLRGLRGALRARRDYLPLTLSFEGFKGWSVREFLPEFGSELARQVELAGIEHPHAAQVQALDASAISYFTLSRFFDQLSGLAPELKVVLLIDEFDNTPQEAISPLLMMWRKIYHGFPTRSLQSVLLISTESVLTLHQNAKIPYNICKLFELPGLTLAEVRALLDEYTTESGQPFAPDVASQIYHQTDGHPFLVNQLAAILTERIVPNRTDPITPQQLQSALRTLLREPLDHFERLVHHASAHQEQVSRILSGYSYRFTTYHPIIRELHMHGVISQTPKGYCRIANPIYEQVLRAGQSH